jgi:pimeloyl-ACP methyl ester carboxylesterase
LGIKNPDLPSLCFDDLARYLKMYIDFVTDYTGSPKVVLVDYSLGAMAANAYAGSYQELFEGGKFWDGRFQDDRIAGIVNIAGPSTLADQPTIKQLRLYNLGAGVLPATPIDPLKIFGKGFVPLAAALAKIPQFLLPHLPVLKDLYDFENMDKAEAAALISLLNYGVEGITPGMLYQLVEVMASDPRGFVSIDGGIDFLANMSRIRVPYRCIGGGVDTLAAEENMRLGFDRLGTPEDQKSFEVVDGASHLGLLLRKKPVERVVDLTVEFMEDFGRVGT